MASENKRGNREAKKPKAPKVKTNASAPSTKGMVTRQALLKSEEVAASNCMAGWSILSFRAFACPPRHKSEGSLNSVNKSVLSVRTDACLLNSSQGGGLGFCFARVAAVGMLEGLAVHAGRTIIGFANFFGRKDFQRCRGGCRSRCRSWQSHAGRPARTYSAAPPR